MDKKRAIERLDALEKEAAELRKIIEAPEEQIPWKPSGGGFYLRARDGFSVCAGSSEESYKKACLEYDNKEAAEKAAEYIKLYVRLVKLASELNKSGKPGGRFGVSVRYLNNSWRTYYTCNDYKLIDGLFETGEIAYKAAQIMNRDGWKHPLIK